MRIKAKPLELDEDTGFDTAIDIFKRADLGERLSNLLQAANEGVIIGIDGAWGEGKSTFAKMLRGHLRKNHEVTTIYFDAFENDYQKDPFIAIAAQIIQQLPFPDKKAESFKKSAVKATKVLAKGALRIGVKTVTAGALDETIFDELGTSDDIAEGTSAALDKFLAKKLESSKEEKESLDSFKKELENLATSLGNGKPITFIIDELDRCKPDYCIELLEQLKHLFTVNNLNFLIITNKTQLLASIKNRYGSEINAHLYLQKFLDLWISLPRIDNTYESHPQKYLDFLLPRLFNEGEKIKNELTFRAASEIFKINNTSLRGIEKTLSYIAILYNSSKNEHYDHYQVAIAVVCYCKAETPETLKLLTQTLDKKSTLESLFTRHDPNESGLIEYTKELIAFCLSDDEEKQKIKNQSRYFSNHRNTPRDNIFADATKALDNLTL